MNIPVSKIISDKNNINNAVDLTVNKLDIKDDFELGFLKRNYRGGDLSPYIERLIGIGFNEKGKVLDAGCGYGQWSIALECLNNNVLGVDIEPKRIAFCEALSKRLSLKNNNYICNTIAEMEGDYLNTFDAIFSYSSLELTPFLETIQSFYSMLKTKGKLYLSCYDLGWMIYLIENKHGENKCYDSRKWAIECIKNTNSYLANKKFNKSSSNDGMYIPQDIILDKLSLIGFEIISVCGDGLTTNEEGRGTYPFAISEYDSYTALYEIICVKK
tara:strand:+ start:10456 stop:11271 length:816 start_codon:yes stop_codon:yes gene_type:complete